jgi:hypothetical protein
MMGAFLHHLLSLRDRSKCAPGISITDLILNPNYRIIVDTDSAAIASRVSRPRPDTTEIVINEQTIMSAYQTVKEKMQQRMGQL